MSVLDPPPVSVSPVLTDNEEEVDTLLNTGPNLARYKLGKVAMESIGTEGHSIRIAD